MQTSAVRARRLALCALLAAVTAVCSQVAVATPWGVPVNLALFAVYMAGTLLGPAWGAASQGVYLALAAFGLPVMAGFQGGPAALFGRTGGYALGYVLAAAVTGFLSQKHRGFGALCAAMALGCAGCYAFGTVWFVALTGMELRAALALCVLPFLPGDAVKIALAATLTRLLDRRLPAGWRL